MVFSTLSAAGLAPPRQFSKKSVMALFHFEGPSTFISCSITFVLDHVPRLQNWKTHQQAFSPFRQHAIHFSIDFHISLATFSHSEAISTFNGL